MSLQGNGDVKGKATIELNESLPLERIRDFTALHSVANKRSIRAQLLCDHQRIDCGYLQFETAPGRGWAHTDTAIKTLLKVCQIAMNSDLRLRFADLQKAASKLIYLTALAGDNSLCAEFLPLEDTPATFHGLLGYAIVAIGPYYFGALVERAIHKDKRIKGASVSLRSSNHT